MKVILLIIFFGLMWYFDHLLKLYQIKQAKDAWDGHIKEMMAEMEYKRSPEYIEKCKRNAYKKLSKYEHYKHLANKVNEKG